MKGKGPRTNGGNMLFLCVVMLALMLLVVSGAFGVYVLFFSHGQLQNSCEDFALRAAQCLNANNHSGKLNHLTIHSRELVYTSRQMYMLTMQDPDFQSLRGLAAKVLDESRRGAAFVRKERELYVTGIISELHQAVKDRDEHPQQGLHLPGASAEDERVTDFCVGTVENTASSVEVSDGVPELNDYDLRHAYIKTGKKLNLYRAMTDLKLPGEDGDLTFELSALPPCVNGTTDPIHLTLGRSFQPFLTLREGDKEGRGTCRLCPSAVKVAMSVKVKEEILGNLDSRTAAVNTAITNGASPEP